MVTVKDDIAMFRFFRPAARQVFLVGEFDQKARVANGSPDAAVCLWQPQPMVRAADGYWVAALRLPPGSHRFRYRADNEWFADYAAFGIEFGPFGPDSVVRVEPSSRPAAALPAGRPEADSPSPPALTSAITSTQERDAQ